MVITKKKKSYRWGLAAENLAAFFLFVKGYRIIARRYKNPKGEIDILAFKDNILVVAEVKARKNIESCAYSIDQKKQKKILGAVEWLMASSEKIDELANKKGHDIRFDAIFIVPWRMPVHLKDAWRI